jgi:uncharacterized damage-inducible protein DinB
MKAYVEQLIDYNYWANGLVMKYAEKLSAEQFLQEHSYSQNSVRDLLAHVMLAERTWLDRMQGKSRVLDEFKKFSNPDRFRTIKTLYGEWFDLELQMRDYLSGFSEKKLLEEFEYLRSDESEHQNRYLDIFTHICFHGMQHRSELAVILTNLGYSPGNLDYIAYLRP